MKIRLILAGFGVIFVAVGLIYYRLGGMKEPAISRVFAPQYMIIGQKFQGITHNNDPKFVAFQTELKSKEAQFSGDFMLIYDQNPNVASEEGVTVFAGYLVTDTTNVPANYVVRNIPEREVIRAKVVSHPLVAPSGMQVENAIRDFAQERGIQIQDIFVEKFARNQDVLVTEIPVKN